MKKVVVVLDEVDNIVNKGDIMTVLMLRDTGVKWVLGDTECFLRGMEKLWTNTELR